MLFISSQKLFSFSRNLLLVLTFWACKTNSLINFEIYDVTARLTMNFNTYAAQYLTNYRQPENEIWSVNRTSQEKHFSLKIMKKMKQGN